MKKIKWRAVLLSLLLAGFGLVIWRLDFPHWKSLDMEALRGVRQTSLLFDAEGNEMAQMHGAENRISLPSDEIPTIVANAFVAAEDARFYEHHGIDIRRIIGALFHNIRTFSAEQGASTITQQLIKLTHLTSQKTLARKANEAVLALQLEQTADKEEILTMYLNTVYFGSGAYGIEAGAQTYFGIAATDLRLHQAALLAAIIKSPSGYAPDIHPDKALTRRNFVLSEMKRCGYIDEGTCQTAQNQPLDVQLTRTNTGGEWYADAAIQEAAERLNISVNDVLSGGYRIYTQFDRHMQQSAEKLFRSGENFPVNAADGTLCEAAFIALDAQSGAIRALIGGREMQTRMAFNRALAMRRQPGSAFKPISVYAAAIDEYRLLPTSLTSDTQRTFSGGYRPKNAGDHYYGTVTLREALSRSLNVAAVDLIEFTGISAARTYAQRAGIPLSARDNGLSLALGALTEGVSPAELAAAYAPLANDGNSVCAHLIARIESAEGHTLYEFSFPSQSVMSADSACLITDMLVTAATSGSASALAASGKQLAGKTGTVSMDNGANRDLWTVAYCKNIVSACWMGFDNPDEAHAIAGKFGGSSYPARLLSAFFSTVSEQTAGHFSLSGGVTRVSLDKDIFTASGLTQLASEWTPKTHTISELFRVDQIPTVVSEQFLLPTPITQLAVSADGEGYPQISFTAADTRSDYELIRRTDGYAEKIASLSAGDALSITYTDRDANMQAQLEYSILPRHRALAALGITLTGAESARVAFSPPPSLLDGIKNLLMPDQASLDTEDTGAESTVAPLF